ncbi:DNA (cytosine-5)-methyltransferase 1 [Dysgonomonas alginatilytica]|uniref:Cytosine-specific methyltransferase n=1 Tax=Dysgonomonas alginatilytica TaxID=1605892 RepID=A0A2V3PUB0_9BACT|nr:DNA (cytosine-5-)-methyltransferase [Dysgonomonas alginatilytica]PXV66905.1 DNA (cytosine-5)-methyltransferase 1 [Dysgonomonas alginatilytica]
MTNKGLILLDLFSGTGGFHKGLTEAGFDFKEVYYSEIDKHAIANYKYNYPHAKHIGSVENIIQSGISRPDIITFGSPCQDFSLAGNRKGLAGDKSSLIQEAITAITHFRPDIFIWENVKGTFSSNAGSDFWAIIQAFANIGGYDIEWQLVNTSWLLPQNRERIYLIGHLTTAYRDWRNVFPVGENETTINKSRQPNKVRFQTNTCTTITTRYGGTASDTYVSVISANNTLQHRNEPNMTKAVINPSRIISNQQCRRIKEIDGEPSFTLTAQNVQGVFDGSIIRRLTEIECERLQGFPDNWTKYGNYDGIIKEVPKTQRYKLLGNAVTAKMVELIGSRLITNFKQADTIRVGLDYGIADDYKQAA